MLKNPIAGIAFALLVLSSCSKDLKDDPGKLNVNNRVSNNSTSPDFCLENINIDNFSAEESIPTTLGPALLGQPFSVENMKQASVNLSGHHIGITVTHRYVRFKPANEDQLQVLADNDEFEVFDYPLDRDVLQEGDYYPQPGITENEIPWLYAVVPSVFNYPAGIQVEILQELHLTNDLTLETEALRITGNSTSDGCGAMARIEGPMVQPCNPLTGEGCGGGGNTPVPVPSKTPAGYIKVQDVELGSDQPVPGVQIVARRWFKIDRQRTDKNGYFACTKSFRNKVNIIVKYNSPAITLRAIKGIRFWQLWFPLKTSIGKFSGRLNNMNYVFTDDGQAKTNRHKLWYASTVVAAHADFNKLAWQIGVGEAPGGLHVIMTTFAAGGGSTTMNRHRTNVGAIPRQFIDYFVAQPGVASLGQLINYLYNSKLVVNADMTLSYATPGVPASVLRTGIYHELAHTAHFLKVGQTWWNNFVYATASETGRNLGNSAYSPYGDGSSGSISDIIGLSESWAEYLAAIMANETYGRKAYYTDMYHKAWKNDEPVLGMSSQLNALEDCNPSRSGYPFKWIPTGVYYDLSDYRNEVVPVIDRVSGYSNSQFFNALTPDVASVYQFKNKLLQNTGNNQDVITLFQSYGY